VLGLEQGEAILESVEVGLADEGPARSVIRLRVGLLVIGVHPAQGDLPRPGTQDFGTLEVRDHSGARQGPGEQEGQAPERLPLLGDLRGPGPAVPDPHRLVEGGRGEPLAALADGDSPDRSSVAPEGEEFVAGRHVPDLHRVVRGG
jgi:hypothetical protein